MVNSLKSKNRSGLLKILITVLLTVIIIIPQTGCSDKDPVSKSEFCLDTSCEITIYDMEDMSKAAAQETLDLTYEEIRKYENLLSKTVEGSDVFRINSAEGGETEVSDDTLDVINTGLFMGNMSGGAFDITVGTLTELWDFKSDNPQVPEESDIKEALESVGYGNVIASGSSVKLTDPDAKLDLGGVAKGYIADKAGEFLEKQGVTKAIVNLGGNITTIGEKDNKTPWTIGVERPYSDRSEIIGSIKVSDQTVVTSGVYERQFVQDGVRYHHVLDPETGYPADTDIEAVTIIAAKGNSGFCDALSTACLILGKEDALELVEKLQKKYPEMGLEAALIDKNDNIVQTDGMDLQKLNQ